VTDSSVTQKPPRLSWRYSELSEASGLSVPYLRLQARIGKLKTRKLSGGAVVILGEDARAFLAGESNEPDGDEAEAA
jgi:hypothetical protein